MILFRQRYLQHEQFGSRVHASARVGAYFCLLTDQYPSTVEEQAVHLEIDYPDVEQGLNRWLPLVKWLLAIPHYVVLAFLAVGAFFAVTIAWLRSVHRPVSAVAFRLCRGRRALGVRVQAYASLLVTDQYPPFSLSFAGP